MRDDDERRGTGRKERTIIRQGLMFFFFFFFFSPFRSLSIFVQFQGFHRTLKKRRAVMRPTATRADRGLESGRLAPLDLDVSSSFFTTSFDSLSKSSVVEREK